MHSREPRAVRDPPTYAVRTALLPYRRGDETPSLHSTSLNPQEAATETYNDRSKIGRRSQATNNGFMNQFCSKLAPIHQRSRTSHSTFTTVERPSGSFKVVTLQHGSPLAFSWIYCKRMCDSVNLRYSRALLIYRTS